MVPLVDIHCHLLAGLDDGPRSVEEAVDMCRLAWDEGTRVMAATAHMGEGWPEVTPSRIRSATAELAQRLQAAGIAMTLYPCAEVMIRPELEKPWMRGELLGVGGGNCYMLMELPDGLFFDIGELVRRFVALGVHPILAHPERHPELLDEPEHIDRLVRQGCLVQVSSSSITEPWRRHDARMLKRWIRQGLVHLIGSDGHSIERRPPQMAEAHRRIAAWAGQTTADRLCGINGLIVLEGLPLKAPTPQAPPRRWFLRSRET